MKNLHHTSKPKALIIGIDGATFDLIKPWAEEGKLPTFKRLLDEGVNANLKSTIPPVTAPAWTSFMTGKNPGKHGLYHFIEFQPQGYEVRYTNARSRLAKTVWNILSESGLNVGVVNVPMTYPPETVNGYMISGLDAPEGGKTVTYPASLYQELEKEFGSVNPQIRYLGFLKNDQRRDEILKSLSEMDEHYLKVMKYLMKRYPVDVAMVVFTATDTVQHFFWHYMDPKHPQYDPVGAKKYGEAILKVYQDIDNTIEKLTADLSEETAVILMSDHGFGPTSSRVIHLNRYLAELGLLKLHNADNAWYHPRSLSHHAIKMADGVIRGALSPQQKAKVAKWFPMLRRKWESQYTGLSNIDWSNTKAYCSEVLTFPASIWINLKGLRLQGNVNQGAEYEGLIQFIIERLYDLKDPITKKQLINRVYRKEDIYHGPYLNHAPDLTLAWWDGSPLLGKPSFPMNGNKDVIGYEDGCHREGDWSGIHALEGILVLHGKNFKNGKMLGHSEIIDLAPTLLHLLNLPIPEDMDGSVLHEAFKEEFNSAHSISKKKVSDYKEQFTNETYSNDESAMVEERLRGLGYIE